MSFFNADALASLRQLNRDSLDSLALIEAPTSTGVPGGGANTGKRAWATIDDGVPCRLAPITQAPIVLQAGQLTTPERLIVVFDVEGVEVLQGYRLTVTGVDTAGANWTRIVLVLSPMAVRTYSAMRTFVCQDVGPSGR